MNNPFSNKIKQTWTSHRGLEELEARDWKPNILSLNHRLPVVALLPVQRPSSSFEVVSCKTMIKFVAKDLFSSFYLKREERDLLHFLFTSQMKEL